MQLFFELLAVFVLTCAGGLTLYFLLKYCVQFYLKNQLMEARKGARLYRPETGHLYGFALLSAITAILLGYLMVGNPAYGLPAIPLLSLLSLPIVSFQKEQRRFRSERAAINFLHGLHGLTQGGIALPTALHHLTVHEKNPFEVTLQRKLKTFSAGRSIKEILSEVRHALALHTVDTCLSALELAYDRGLPIHSILSDALPTIEAEADMLKKTSNLRKTVAVQATLSSTVPWIVLGTIYCFQPDIVREFFSDAMAAWIVGITILWSGIGIAALWRASEFY